MPCKSGRKSMKKSASIIQQQKTGQCPQTNSVCVCNLFRLPTLLKQMHSSTHEMFLALQSSCSQIVNREDRKGIRVFG